MLDIRELVSKAGDLVLFEALLKAKRSKYDEYMQFIRQYNMLEVIVAESRGGCCELTRGLEKNADRETAENLRIMKFLDYMQERIRNHEIAHITAEPPLRSLEIGRSPSVATAASDRAEQSIYVVTEADTRIQYPMRTHWRHQSAADEQPRNSFGCPATVVELNKPSASGTEDLDAQRISPEREETNHEQEFLETTTVNVRFEVTTTTSSQQGTSKTVSRRIECPSPRRSFVLKRQKSPRTSQKSKKSQAAFIKNLINQCAENPNGLVDLFIPQTIYNIRNQQLQNRPQKELLLGHKRDHRYDIEEMDKTLALAALTEPALIRMEPAGDEETPCLLKRGHEDSERYESELDYDSEAINKAVLNWSDS